MLFSKRWPVIQEQLLDIVRKVSFCICQNGLSVHCVGVEES